MRPHDDEPTHRRREISRRGLLALGAGAAGGMLVTAQASGLLPQEEAEASGNFVAAVVVSSKDGVLEVDRVDNQERLSVVIDFDTRLPDPTLATAERGRTVGINAPDVARARADSTVHATVVAPCVLGLLSEANQRQDVGSGR